MGRKRPRWMRNNVSCPECGHIYTEDTLNEAMPGRLERGWIFRLTHPKGFTCVKCKAHFTVAEFWKENEEKWNREMKENENAEEES